MKNQSQFLTKKQFDQDVQDTLEMSQIWDSDAALEDIVDKSSLKQKDTSLLKFSDRQEKYFDEIHHDSDDIFSSSPELTSLTNTHPSQHIETDIEDLFASPPNDSPTASSSSNAKKAKISSQKSIDTKLKPKQENEDDSEWDDDSFWNTINFDTQQ